jgi:hypothetical protein
MMFSCGAMPRKFTVYTGLVPASEAAIVRILTLGKTIEHQIPERKPVRYITLCLWLFWLQAEWTDK